MARVIGNHISLEMFLLWVLEFALAFLVFYVLLLPGAVPHGAAGFAGLDLATADRAATLGVTVGLTSVTIGLYRPEICLETRRLMVNSVVAGVIGFPVILMVSVASNIDTSFLLGQDALWPMKMLLSWVLLLFGTRLIMRVAVHFGLLTRKVVIVGSPEQAAATATAIAAMRRQLFAVADIVPPAEIVNMTGDQLRQRKIWGVIVANGAQLDVSTERLLAVKYRGVQVFGDVAFREQQLRRMDLDTLGTDWLCDARGIEGGIVVRMVRRAAELGLSLVALVLTLPLLALSAIAIKLDSPGPVLYRQVRVGLHGRPFTLLKLRSMRTDAEVAGPAWATVDDSRVTRVGAFLRVTRIDELPQLINVLRGEMGFVGPRPERPHFVDQLAAQIPHYADRHLVKPGVTGWAQVSFRYGASIDDSRQKLSYDLYYAKHRNLFLDMLILIATVRVILFQEGAR
jgi:exopolysaccharide biosynthesis polyprenyl glycosylphosphotransferase